MGILNIFKRDVSSATAQEPTAPTTPPTEPEVSDVLLNALLRGDPITREQAMTIPAVSAAVDFISGSIASMPVKLYWIKENEAGEPYVESRDDDARVKKLNNDTGDTLDAYQMKKAMVEDYLMGRGGYAYIQRGERSNDVGGLYYVQDDFVTVEWNADPIFKKRKLFVYDKSYELFDFIKLLRNTKDGAMGVGLTVEVSKALETAYNTLIYQLSAAKNGGNKKGFIKSTKRLGQTEIDVLKTAWRNMYANSGESVVVLNNGLEFQEASNSATEMQLDQNKKTLTDEINAIFHIYPSDYYRTFKEAIYPIVKAFETALNHDLLLENEKGKKFFEFDVKEILRVDIKERYEAYKLAKETGFMTLNEIRRAENLGRIEGLDVVNVGLSAVLYDTNTHQYYTPNTDASHDMQGIEKEIVDHDVISEQEQEGNID
ncbi:MAG: phage portal protein [Clostridia bacterium]|nr:phage portal protein [Clostridia bacterium]